MELFLRLLCIFAVFTCFGATQAFAQKTIKTRRFIKIELSVPGYDEIENLKVPISPNYGNGYGIGGGGGCGECDAGQPGEYSYEISASKSKGNKFTVDFRITVSGLDDNRKHKIRKSFIVHYNRKTVIVLKYGIKFTAYYISKNRKAH